MVCGHAKDSLPFTVCIALCSPGPSAYLLQCGGLFQWLLHSLPTEACIDSGLEERKCLQGRLMTNVGCTQYTISCGLGPVFVDQLKF